MLSAQNWVKKLFHDTAAVVIQGDLQSQAMVRAVARQVCEQLIQGKYMDSPYASLSRMERFLPQLLTNMTLLKISKGICLFYTRQLGFMFQLDLCSTGFMSN